MAAPPPPPPPGYNNDASYPPQQNSYYGPPATSSPDAAWKPTAAPPPGQPVMGAVAAPAEPCRFTRGELMKLLADSGYGDNRGMYSAYFRQLPDGGHVCGACSLPIGSHTDAAVDTAPAAGAATVDFPAPPANPHEVFKSAIDSDSSNADPYGFLYPEHWSGGAWFAPLLEFQRWRAMRVQEHDVRGRKGHVTHMPGRASADFTCRVVTSTGAVCGHVFEIAGYRVNDGRPQGFPDYRLENTTQPSIEQHMKDAHGLSHRPAGKWTTGLLAICEHPAAACECATSYCLVSQCTPVTGDGMCCRTSAPLVESEGLPLTVVGSQLRPNCSGGLGCMVIFVPFALHATLFFALAFVGSIVTICGYPCASDSLAPLVCLPCFKKRRALVKKLGVDEGDCATRSAVLFCCACSELQVWRETRNSGVWPGLLCCAPGEDDRHAMQLGTVRQRYMHSDGQGSIVADPMVPGAQYAAQLLLELPLGNVGFPAKDLPHAAPMV